MSLLKNLDTLETKGKVGDWSFLKNKDGQHIFIRYPRKEEEIFGDEARGEIVNLPICEGEKLPNVWLWDSNKEAPTITPSINVIGLWHGYLTAGKLITV
jgi:hypothetical protein